MMDNFFKFYSKKISKKKKKQLLNTHIEQSNSMIYRYQHGAVLILVEDEIVTIKLLAVMTFFRKNEESHKTEADNCMELVSVFNCCEQKRKRLHLDFANEPSLKIPGYPKMRQMQYHVDVAIRKIMFRDDTNTFSVSAHHAEAAVLRYTAFRICINGSVISGGVSVPLVLSAHGEVFLWEIRWNFFPEDGGP
ncbi:unnamed protein product [Caenorhabditis brenneri]